jgi:1-acyl-sn-glycerol-3-phosphate acyltransferase
MLVYALSAPFLGHNDQRAFKLRRHWLRYIGLPILNIKVTSYGTLPSEGVYLYVSNHRSFSDPVIMCNYIDAFVVAKAEVANYPIINKGAELTGVIYVNRGEKSSRAAVRKEMKDVLLGGKSILIYPEGTVSKHQNILPYKIGAFIMAAENNIPVVPIVLEYRDTKDLWLVPPFLSQVMRQYSAWTTEVRLSIGDIMRDTDGQNLHHKVEAWTKAEVSRLQTNWTRAQYLDA